MLARLAAAGAPPPEEVELLGGGSRMPAVQEAVREAFGGAAAPPLCSKLDDMALARGAALEAAGGLAGEADGAEHGALGAAELERFRAEEAAMARADAAARRVDDLRNDVEQRVLELRAAMRGEHGSLIDAGALTPVLDAAEEWLYSYEDESTTDPAALEAKVEELRAAEEEHCARYREARQEATRTADAALEADAAAAAAEREAAPEGDDDHDFRKLKASERIRMVEKNKAEGTELFRGGVYRQAAARYHKALTHAEKVFDASLNEQEQLATLKKSLWLNLAQAYLKLENWAQAQTYSNHVLEADADNVKALFRRGTALMRLNKREEATRDLRRAAELAPQDAAVQQLLGKLNAAAAKERKRERAMAAKMFA
mmetsp:Transcript_5416/g.18110  ORF Transcript_5416/g.18110 Transcript_5416/m.18110 type:complete len:373 (-) Transcript_5416:194-1312(-)